MKNVSDVLKLAAVAVSFFGQVMPMAAQTGVSLDGYIRFMPKQFSYTGKPQAITVSFPGPKICVYDENFELKKEFAQNYPSQKRVVKEERVIIPGKYVEYEENYYDENFYIADGASALDYVIERVSQYGAVVHTVDGTVHTFRPEGLSDNPDLKHYEYYTYIEGESYMRMHSMRRYPKYSPDFVTYFSSIF